MSIKDWGMERLASDNSERTIFLFAPEFVLNSGKGNGILRNTKAKGLHHTLLYFCYFPVLAKYTENDDIEWKGKLE